MRISTLQYFKTGVGSIQAARDSLSITQQKIATGKSILTPSEDPIRSTQVLKINEELSLNMQFQENISFAIGKNELEDSVVGSTIDALQRVRDLVVQANSDALSDQDRRGIGIEIESLLDQMVSLFNTRDGSGEYMFAGYQGSSAPFVQQPGGGYEYLGDDGTRSIQISQGSVIEVSDSGKSIFVDVKSANNTIYTYPSPNNTAVPAANISTGLVVNQDEFDAAYPEDFNIIFNDPLVNQNQRTFTITQRSDGAPVFGTRPGGYMINVPYNDGELLEFSGVEFFITGDPEPGDTFFIESSATESTLDTVDRLRSVLALDSNTSVQTSSQINVIGRATPARTTTTLTGNYVAEQEITVQDSTTIQQVDILSNESAVSIAAKLDALIGVTANAVQASAVFDLSSTPKNEGDILQFELNGMSISITVDVSPTVTWATLSTAITTAIAADVAAGGIATNNMGAELIVTNNGGVFDIDEPNGYNIDIQNFEVINIPGISFGVNSGFDVGDAIGFTFTGTGGESIDINYIVAGGAVAAQNNEMLAQMNIDLAADPEGDGAAFTVVQPVVGGPLELRYLNDTDGLSNIQITGFTDGDADDAQLAVSSLLGSSVVNSATGISATSLANGVNLTVLAVDVDATARFTGSVGSYVTLLEGDTDSSSVAGTLNVTTDPSFEIASNVNSAFGGLFTADIDFGDITNDRFQETIERVLANIDQSIESILKTRSNIGSRLNSLDATMDLNIGINIELKTYLSDLQDLDYAEAITTLNLQTMILEASQNSFIKISSLTLFNYL